MCMPLLFLTICYEIQTETISEDCVHAGIAHLAEQNRIPQTALGVNVAGYDDTLHNGYDVFVIYTPNVE